MNHEDWAKYHRMAKFTDEEWQHFIESFELRDLDPIYLGREFQQQDLAALQNHIVTIQDQISQVVKIRKMTTSQEKQNTAYLEKTLNMVEKIKARQVQEEAARDREAREKEIEQAKKAFYESAEQLMSLSGHCNTSKLTVITTALPHMSPRDQETMRAFCVNALREQSKNKSSGTGTASSALGNRAQASADGGNGGAHDGERVGKDGTDSDSGKEGDAPHQKKRRQAIRKGCGNGVDEDDNGEESDSAHPNTCRQCNGSDSD